MRVRRADDLREVRVEGGRASVTRGGQVIVLSDVATAILRAVPADSAVSLGAITAAVVDEMGAPEPPLDALGLTRGLVLELVAHGVLVDETPTHRDSLRPESVTAVREALRHVVSTDSSPWVLPPGVAGPDFLLAAHRHRVVSVLADAHPPLALPEDTLNQLVATAQQEAVAVDQMAEDLVEAVEAITRAGLRVLAFDGLPLAVQAHGHLGARGTGHHSLLVSPLELEQANDVLTSLGWSAFPGFPVPGREGDAQQLIQDLHELPLTRESGSIKLQWHLTPVGEAMPEFEDLWSRHTSVEIFGRDVPTLAAYDALAHAAHRSARDDWGSLRGLLDVWRLLGNDDVWRDLDGPLREDQLLSLGLAVRTFGMPRTRQVFAHAAAAREAARVSAEAWETATTAQVAAP